MMNISPNSIKSQIDSNDFESLRITESKNSGNAPLRLFIILGAFLIAILFIPWTQNIRSRGNMTTLNPWQRVQSVNTVIAGRIEKWFVREGDHVKKGDTLLFISEIKDEYFDPGLLERTGQQLKSKELSVNAYMEKVKSIDIRIDALTETSQLKQKQAINKLKQSQLKVVSDSMEYHAAQMALQVALDQNRRMEKLYGDGLKSLTDLETRNLTLQKARASLTAAESKLLSSRNEVLNAQMELNSVSAQYRDDIAKAESEKFSAMSSMYDAEAIVTKMQNQYTNYSMRSGMYYILSPQDGFIARTLKSGIGETIKEGSEVVTIMPETYDLAAELYVRPIDVMLIAVGQKVRLQFDGWPAIVFSGWPNTSYGTYGGKVYSIDRFISENGMYRVLVAPDQNDHPWPKGLRPGAGASSMMLLKDVALGYELWRQFNGFPPDFYGKNDDEPKRKGK